MPAALTVPMGTLTSLGVGKESTSGVFAVPTIWHALKNFSPSSSNLVIARTGARKRWGQSEPITGGYQFSASLGVEADPDTLPQLWAYALGNQSAPSHNIVNTTLSASTLVAATTFTVASTVGMQIGCTVTIDTSTNAEPLVVSNIVTPTSFTTTTGATKAHASGAAVTLTSTSAYLTYLKMGPLPSFSIELDAQADVLQYTGLYVDSFAVNMNATSEVEATFSLEGISEDIKGAAATTPVYSVLKPLSTVDARSNVMIANVGAGDVGQVGVSKLAFSVANNLKKGYYSIGTGRRVLTFPQLQRKVTGTLELGFETDAAYRAFLGGAGATTPQSDVPGVQINAQVVSPGVVDATTGLQYAINVIIPDAKFTKFGMKVTSNDMIMQSISWEASESGNGNNDDFSMYVTNAASAVY